MFCTCSLHRVSCDGCIQPVSWRCSSLACFPPGATGTGAPQSLPGARTPAIELFWLACSFGPAQGGLPGARCCARPGGPPLPAGQALGPSRGPPPGGRSAAQLRASAARLHPVASSSDSTTGPPPGCSFGAPGRRAPLPLPWRRRAVDRPPGATVPRRAHSPASTPGVGSGPAPPLPRPGPAGRMRPAPARFPGALHSRGAGLPPPAPPVGLPASAARPGQRPVVWVDPALCRPRLHAGFLEWRGCLGSPLGPALQTPPRRHRPAVGRGVFCLRSFGGLAPPTLGGSPATPTRFALCGRLPRPRRSAPRRGGRQGRTSRGRPASGAWGPCQSGLVGRDGPGPMPGSRGRAPRTGLPSTGAVLHRAGGGVHPPGPACAWSVAALPHASSPAAGCASFLGRALASAGHAACPALVRLHARGRSRGVPALPGLSAILGAAGLRGAAPPPSPLSRAAATGGGRGHLPGVRGPRLPPPRPGLWRQRRRRPWAAPRRRGLAPGAPRAPWWLGPQGWHRPGSGGPRWAAPAARCIILSLACSTPARALTSHLGPPLAPSNSVPSRLRAGPRP